MSFDGNGELVPVGGGDNIPLLRSPLVMGRRSSCDVHLDFPNVSGKHCELSYTNGFWVLRDLDSTNGVKVNGLRVLKKVLAPGDVISIAKRSYTIQYQPTGRADQLDELTEQVEGIMDRPLLEKAGLERPRTQKPREKVNPLAPPPDPYAEDDE